MPYISIKSGINELIIEPQGGQLVQWYHDGVGVFYQGSSIRRSGIPILFPFANPLKDGIFQLSGKLIGQHGFGRDSLWQVLERNDSSISLTLTPQNISSEMQIAYPLDFEAVIGLEVLDNTLKYTLSVKNNSSVDLPIAPGLHPYFPIKHNEKSNLVISGIDNTIDWESESSGYFYDFDGQFELQFPDGRMIEVAEIGTNYVENIVLWSQTPANSDYDFVCVEPFTRKTNAINDNPILVKPKETWSSTIAFTLKITG
jgi:galactose mutarotase-like enzyme